MCKYYHLIMLFLTFYIISCNEDSNPVKVEDNNKHINYCSIVGLEIGFSDTCSYKFITTFLSEFDSVRVTQTFLGDILYIYADSADIDYWLNYFENDSTIQNILVDNNADSLILKIRLTGKKSTEEEQQRFLRIEHLTLIKIEEHPKLVYIDVPENTESDWEAFFNQFVFISHVYIMGICVSS